MIIVLPPLVKRGKGHGRGGQTLFRPFFYIMGKEGEGGRGFLGLIDLKGRRRAEKARLFGLKGAAALYYIK